MSIWSDIQDRSSGETVRKEDLEEGLKKKLDAATKKYIEGYLDLMFEYGCTVEDIKHCYKLALDEMGDFCIVDSLDEESKDLYWEKKEEWKLSTYVYGAIKHYGQEIFSNIQDGDARVKAKKENNKPIDYAMLRVVLKYQIEKVLEKESPIPGNIPIIGDLYDRTLEIFEYIFDKINNDSELKNLLEEKNVDGSVERLVVLISKYDGTNIPVPYEDIDDWWGDYNSTINYLSWDYNGGIEREKKNEEERLRMLSLPRKCKAVITKIGAAKKIGGFYTKDKKLIKLDEVHQQSLRWHEHVFELKDMRFNEKYPGKGWYAMVLTKKGETGEKIVLNAISQVEKKYGEFDGYTCDDWTFYLDQYVTDKNKKMVSEITDLLEKHNLKMAGVQDK